MQDCDLEGDTLALVGDGQRLALLERVANTWIQSASTSVVTGSVQFGLHVSLDGDGTATGWPDYGPTANGPYWSVRVFERASG